MIPRQSLVSLAFYIKNMWPACIKVTLAMPSSVIDLVTALTLAGCGFDPWPGHIKGCIHGPLWPLLGTQHSELEVGL